MIMPPQPLGKDTKFPMLIHHTNSNRPFDPDVPSSAAVTELRQELRDVKSQVLELKQLMRTSFDLQLEIQRAIRQEVAAALSSAFAPQPPSVQSRPSIPPCTCNRVVSTSTLSEFSISLSL